MTSTLVPNEKTVYKTGLREYKKQFRNFLLTSRFNDETWYENNAYRQKHKNFGCVYCSPELISRQIPQDAIMFILEMNNDTNEIMGIGMVKNRPIVSKYKVYSHGNYNRYVFVGKHRISRDEMDEQELLVMKVFDILCFTGNRHMKRGQGLKSFPVDMLYRCSKKFDLVQFIVEMFKKRITSN
jgi:hypothetical protein